MNLALKSTRTSIWTAVLCYILQAISFGIGLAMAMEISWPLDSDTSFLIIPAAVMLWFGILSIYRLMDFILLRRYTGEVRFDGTTVVSRVAGKSPQSFTKPEVRAYFPHRNEVLLDDDRCIPLPCCAHQLNYNEPEMATPWVSQWWPGLQLPAAIRAAEKAQGWIRHAQHGIRLIGLAGMLYLSTNPSYYTATIPTAFLFMQIYLPDWVDGRVRRKVVVRFEQTAELSTPPWPEGKNLTAPASPSKP